MRLRNGFRSERCTVLAANCSALLSPSLRTSLKDIVDSTVPRFVQHLSIAYGFLARGRDIHSNRAAAQYLSASDVGRLLDRKGEVGRLLNGLLRYLRRQPTSEVGNPTA